jgi:hypothetical protein
MANAKRWNEEGLRLVIALSQKPDAQSFVLDLAADYLLRPGPDAKHETKRDPALALGFAERALKVSAIPAPAQLVHLGQAQRAMGDVASSKASAEKALTLLAVHPHCVGNAEQTALAQKLLSN